MQAILGIARSYGVHMKTAFTLVLLFALGAIAHAQTYPTTPNIVATKHPGWTVHWTWVAPTQNTDGTAVSGVLTYDVYMSTGGAFTKIASALTTTGYAETNLPAGIPCIYVIANESGANTIPSPPSEIVCVNDPPLSVQPNAVSSMSGY